ncbi:MAG TPA: hypothetical protein VJ806_10235 [Luteimonas sp.]|nr:hypothetical protein [Luteimonas sp.]
MHAALVLFALAAVGGLTMAFMRWRGTPRPPDWLAMAHGLLAAAGLTLLIQAAVVSGLPTLGNAALGLFVLAALGGAFVNLTLSRQATGVAEGVDRRACAAGGGRVLIVAGGGVRTLSGQRFAL